MSSPLLSSRNSHAHEQKTLSLELSGSSDGVWVVRISSVNDDVSLLHDGRELSDQSVDGLSSLNEEDD